LRLPKLYWHKGAAMAVMFCNEGDVACMKK
jgi:hypothetical protein